MPKLTGDEALRQWLNAELDNIRAIEAEEPADLPRFLLRPDKQHAIKPQKRRHQAAAHVLPRTRRSV